MSDNEKISARIVGDQPIAKSFKGILRVSNVKEPTNSPDVFLHKDYYGEYKSNEKMPLWEPVGDQNMEPVLTGENERYVIGDRYTELRIPVTDSIGNYMNFSLGSAGSLIGSNSSTGNWTLNGVPFYILDSETINIGLEPIKSINEKSISGGLLAIDNGSTPAKLVVDSYYKHGATYDGNFVEIDEDEKIRKTIYEANISPQQYDAFLFNQEYFSENGTERHNTVKLKNLRDYVSDKVESYIKFNTTEVPTGAIIWQYCDLAKWYCSINDGVDDSEYWQGFRPALGNIEPGTDAKESASVFGIGNTEQGIFSNKTRLEYKLSSYVFESLEMPPEFKRGYALADGSAYEIRLVPSYLNDVESTNNTKKTLDLFLKLFFVLGYYYTPKVPAFPHRYYEAENAPVQEDESLKSKPTEGRYYYDYDDPGRIDYSYQKYIFSDIPKETLYGISLSSILAFKKFVEAYEDRSIFNAHIADDEGNWDIEKSIQWLSQQTIGEEFTFNTVFTPETRIWAKENNIEGIDNILYKYSDVDGHHNLEIPVGKEVNKFSDYIDYYTFEVRGVSNIIMKNVACPIYKTAEIYDIARLFANKSAEWANYKVKFNVPALYSDKDRDIINYNILSGNTQNNGVGLFIGSSGFTAADTVRIPSKSSLYDEDLIYYNINDSYTYQQSNCTFTIGHKPHSHALAKGILYYDEGKYPVSPEEPKHLSSLSISNEDAKNTLLNLDDVENCIISADTTWGNYSLKSKSSGPHAWADEPGALNYLLQERGKNQGVTLHNVYNGFNGIMGKELAVDEQPEMKWYAKTSGPIWDPTPISTSGSQKYIQNESPGYFKPQSIKLLPLIKL